jgi:hypothetical protein
MNYDAVLGYFVSMFRVGMEREQPKIKETWKPERKMAAMELSAESFRGLTILPSTTSAGGERTAELPHPQMYWLNDCQFFWQCIFLSMLTGSGPAVCQGCGRMMGDKTAKGRPKKACWCNRCRQRNWRKKQSIEKMRRKWRTDQKKKTINQY